MKKTVKITIASLAIASTSLVMNPAVASDKERCYGVAKAGENDCETKNSSCAGTSKVDGQKDAFVIVAKGLCERLAGGSLTSS